MSEDFFRYDLLVQDALRGVVRDILSKVVAEGLPGEHHFYIAFRTQAPGVIISPRFHEKYPQEMTIVVQHQFWDLIVSEDKFEIGLSFNNIPEKLVIPFAALTGFMDPSTQFGLQFEHIDDEKSAESEPPEKSDGGSMVPSIAARRKTGKKDSLPAPKTKKAAKQESSNDSETEEDAAQQTGEVVQLDSFRKKN